MMRRRRYLTGKTTKSVLAVVARHDFVVQRVDVYEARKDGKDPVRIYYHERKSGGGEDPFPSSTLQSIRAVSLQNLSETLASDRSYDRWLTP
jgi:hypothetical protein